MKRTLFAVIIALGLPAVAGAQSPGWTEKVQIGEPVFITTRAGDRVDGIAGQVTTEGLVVSTPIGTRTVPYREMRRVERRDPAWTGAVIGAATGIFAGIVAALVSDCHGRQCQAEERGLVMTGALYGVITGWTVDFNHSGKSTIFKSDASAKVTVAPRRGGLSAAIAFNW